VQKDPSFPPASHAFFIVFTSILFFTLLGVMWEDLPSKWEMVILEITVIVPVLIYIRIRKYSFRRIFRLHPVKRSILLVSGLIGLGLSVVTEEINRLVQFVLPMPETLVESLEQTLLFHSVSEFLVLVLGGVLIAGFLEEMLFRGFFQGAMEQATDVTRAVLITALVFTMSHFNPWWAVEILVLGVVLGVMTWRSNSIYPAVTVHCVNNGLSVFMLNIDPVQLKWYHYKEHVSPVWIVLSIVLVYLGFRLFYQLTEKNPNKKTHLRPTQSV
jgi:membrane protease YdiL (CAAX protease family)